jgi:hypothetical protein
MVVPGESEMHLDLSRCDREPGGKSRNRIAAEVINRSRPEDEITLFSAPVFRSILMPSVLLLQIQPDTWAATELLLNSSLVMSEG